MSTDPRRYEARVNTAEFLDANGQYTPDPPKSLPLNDERQKIVDTVIRMYSGQMKQLFQDMAEAYHKEAVYDDIMSFADTRRKIAAQFVALPMCFKEVQVQESEVARNDEDLIVLKLATKYAEPVIGSKIVKHLVTLSLDNSTGEAIIRYHKDQWNEKDYSHSGLGAIFKKMNGETVPKLLNLPDYL